MQAFLPLYLEYIAQFDVSFCSICFIMELIYDPLLVKMSFLLPITDLVVISVHLK